MTRQIPAGRGLTAEERAVVDAFDSAPPAPETFRHLTTCEATDDAPRLCECPPSVVSIASPVRRGPVPSFLTGCDRPGGGDPMGDYLHLKGEGR